VEDGLGYFWLSSDRGIVRVRKQDLEEYADGQRDQFASIHYGKDDDLANLECLSGYQPSAWRTRAGHIWFATSKGAVAVNPAALPTNSRQPMLVLERVRLDGQEVTDLHEFKLDYGYRKLDFEYTAPSFTAPENIQFRRRLVGLDADWIEDGTIRSASYPRLPPGRYVFQFWPVIRKATGTRSLCPCPSRSPRPIGRRPGFASARWWRLAAFARKVVLFFHSRRTGTTQIEQLTRRKIEILNQLAKGESYKEIAHHLSISLDTVRTHLQHIYNKLQVHSRHKAVQKFLGQQAEEHKTKDGFQSS